jgi:uncharacterized small protein (DUF1192 family)
MNENQTPQGNISIDDLIAIIGRKEIQIQMLSAEIARLQKEAAEMKKSKVNKD